MPNDNKNFKNLQYLGFEFNGQSIYVRPGSLSRYFRKMKARIVKTVSMAYSTNSKSDKINKNKYSVVIHILVKGIFYHMPTMHQKNTIKTMLEKGKKEWTHQASDDKLRDI